jgi:hypothetical protein
MQPTNLALDMGHAVVDGAAAGAVAVVGIRPFDQLLLVVDLTALLDLTTEFSISDEDEIDNAGGTSTDTNRVLVLWMRNLNQ